MTVNIENSVPRQPFFTVAEVQEILKIKDRGTIYRMMKEGVLQHVRVGTNGRLIRFPRENLIAYLETLYGPH